MSDETRAALLGAVSDHRDARNLAAVAGDDPEAVPPDDALAAAREHLAAVDPGYFDRVAEAQERYGVILEPHQRRLAPDLQAEYQAARDAADAAPGDWDLAQAAADLAHELAAVNIARRLLEWGPGAGERKFGTGASASAGG
jgi:hypothetical protein